jgi:hypothetical protein
LKSEKRAVEAEPSGSDTWKEKIVYWMKRIVKDDYKVQCLGVLVKKGGHDEQSSLIIYY